MQKRDKTAGQTAELFARLSARVIGDQIKLLFYIDCNRIKGSLD